MKKTVVILLALAVFACCAAAFAEEEAGDIPPAGLDFTPSGELAALRGVLDTDGASFLEEENIWYACWYYCAGPREKLEEVLNGESEEEVSDTVDVLFYVFAVGNGNTFSYLCDVMASAELSEEKAVEIGRDDSYIYYLYMTDSPEFGTAMPAEYRDEYAALCGMQDQIAASFACGASGL